MKRPTGRALRAPLAGSPAFVSVFVFVLIFGFSKFDFPKYFYRLIYTINLVKASSHLNCKFVYVSSEYVFKGDKGNYTINDRDGKKMYSEQYLSPLLANFYNSKQFKEFDVEEFDRKNNL